MIPSLAYYLALLNLLVSPSLVNAGSLGFGDTCNITHNRLSPDTKQLMSDCIPSTYCSGNTSTCLHKGCRKDEYPYGYKLFQKPPPKCHTGWFCPDEGDACQEQMPVGSACQLDRDDECAPPPNWNDLAGPNNFNGSVCLNFQCMYANATLGNTCVVENTAYIGYQAGSGAQFINVVSRGNCVTGLYCDAVSLKCLATLALGETCTADKECDSDNCTEQGLCGAPADQPKAVSAAVYVAVSVCIIGIIAGTLIGLYILHRRHRLEEREKRAQYWREQEQFRQNIMQMREQARTSLLSLPWQGDKEVSGLPSATNPFDRSYAPSETSQTPMLYAASQPSGLRNGFSDGGYGDDTSIDKDSGEESLMTRAAPRGVGGQSQKRQGPAPTGRRI